MKRGLSGKTRRGSPPLPRQRKALRVVQLTLVALAVCLVVLAASALQQHRHPLAPGAVLGASGGHGFGEVVALGREPSPLPALPLPWGCAWCAGPTRTSRNRGISGGQSLFARIRANRD